MWHRLPVLHYGNVLCWYRDLGTDTTDHRTGMRGWGWVGAGFGDETTCHSEGCPSDGIGGLGKAEMTGMRD